MSTKIYNGYRLAAGENLFTFTKQVRALIDPIRDEVDAALLARLSTNALDSCWIKSEAVPSMLAFTTFMKWEEGQKKLDDTDRRKDPNRFELCLGEDPETGRILIRLFTDQPSMRDAFEAMDEVEAYSYWNNADEPEGVTSEQWNERGAAWERVMPGYLPPAETMLTFVLRTEGNPRTMMLCDLEGGADSPVLRKVPSRAERALNVARTRYLHQLVKVQGVEELAALRHALTSRIKEKLQAIAVIVEPHLWDVTRELLNDGGQEHPTDPQILPAVDAACSALYEAEQANLPSPAGG